MKKCLKTLIALGLATAMLAGCGNTGTTSSQQSSSSSQKESSSAAEESSSVVEESKYPDYLNLDGYRPIVKEGNDITLKVAIGSYTDVEVDYENNWFVNFVEQELGINLEIEQFSDKERKSVMLASGELPDLMIHLGFSSNEIYRYGVEDHLFLDWTEYACEELTPNYCAMVEKWADYMDYFTQPDGSIIRMPVFRDRTDVMGGASTYSIYRAFVSSKYMAAAGITEVPTTLDGFLDMCRALKEVDYSQFGVEGDVIPILDQYDYLYAYLYTAFGWVSDGWASHSSPVWDNDQGKMVIPMLDDKFEAFVGVLHTLYSEGLIHEDYLTIEDSANGALMQSGNAAVHMTSGPQLNEYAGSTGTDWYVLPPLTSEWNKTPVTASGDIPGGSGSAYISATTEYPELCLRLLDYLYSPEGQVYCNYGPMAGTEDTLGMVTGWHLEYKEETNSYSIVLDELVNGKADGTYSTDAEYYGGKLLLMNPGHCVHQDGLYLNALAMGGVENAELPKIDWSTNTNYRIAEACEGACMLAPGSMVITEETRAEYQDLRTAMSTFMKQRVAEFIVGQRDMSEFPAFQEELRAMGADRLLEIVEQGYEGVPTSKAVDYSTIIYPEVINKPAE